MSHTPGPWHVSWKRVTVAILDARGHYITENLRAVPDQEANAYLIAAAPDLLAAMKEIEALSSGWDACGGSLGAKPPLSWESVARIAMNLARVAIAKAEAR